MLKKIFIIFNIPLFILLNNELYSQKEGNIWYFSDSCGISFNNSPPSVLTDGISTTFNTAATISDKYGQFLFYIDLSNKLDVSYNQVLCRLINRNHETLKNSDSLRLDITSFQGALILPKPGSNNIYYIFQHATSVANIVTTPPFIGHLYSIVDMNLDNGLGEVISKNNLLIDERLSEKMIAIKHGNGRDWWILLHGYGDLFYKVLFTPIGIDTILEQNIGPYYNYLWNSNFHDRGNIASSLDGTRIALADNYNKLDLFNFDRCTGEISNWIQIAPQIGSGDSLVYIGVAFSPNGKLFYTTARTDNQNFVFQYDIQFQNNITRQTIWQIQTGLDFNSTMRLTPQKKIYITNAYSSFLHIIHNPDSIGNACHFEENGFDLQGRKNKHGLPNIPNFKLGPLLASACDTLSIVQPEDPPEELSIGINNQANVNSDFSIYPNPASTSLTIDITCSDYTSAELILYNALGQVVMAKAIKAGTKSMSVDISNLKTGFYNYAFNINNKRIAFDKLIVIR